MKTKWNLYSYKGSNYLTHIHMMSNSLYFYFDVFSGINCPQCKELVPNHLLLQLKLLNGR